MFIPMWILLILALWLIPADVWIGLMLMVGIGIAVVLTACFLALGASALRHGGWI